MGLHPIDTGSNPVTAAEITMKKLFPTNTLVRVVDGNWPEKGSVGIVTESSDEFIARVFIIRGPYWKANDPLMIGLHSRRNSQYIRSWCLEEATDVKLTEHERSNLKKWWDAHGFDADQVK